jgi:hypothetical protein
MEVNDMSSQITRLAQDQYVKKSGLTRAVSALIGFSYRLIFGAY